jgi:autotransporter passenger strand-loop-strand repeat protein
MTTYTAPPDRFGLVLNNGDILNVNFHGVSADITMNAGGIENVDVGGLSNFATINNGGIENVHGDAHATTVNNGGIENVYGRSVETEIDKGGVENIQSGGLSVRTHIDGGVEHVLSGGTAENAIFQGSDSTLELATPTGLNGAIVNWRVGDVVDLQNTVVTGLDMAPGILKVSYGSHSVSYGLGNEQAGTFIHAVSDGHGGTDLIMTPIVGVHHHELDAALHF